MTDHVDDLAEAISRARIENTCFSEGPGEVDDHTIARAVLLHLREAPGEDDYVMIAMIAATYSDLHSLDVRISWQAMFDRMLGT